MSLLFPRKTVEAMAQAPRRTAVSEATLRGAAAILADVQARGETAVLEHAVRLGDIPPGGPWLLGREQLRLAWESLEPDTQGVIERTAERIRTFARAQRRSMSDTDVAIPGGRIGHTLVPVERAGCYAPGGRFPLPSSVLMTAVTAREAAVGSVWVASPRPTVVTLAAAHVANADGFVCVGGAQAVAALAYGAGALEPMDVIAGPGNAWVTAAKQLVSGRVGIDMLAGPSELVVLADDTADPAMVAADLLAQAEHDDDALPVLVTTHAPLVAAVELELERQFQDLPTAATARAALASGCSVVASGIDEALELVSALAPEHLELLVRNAHAVAGGVKHAGALFIGPGSAEVLGDYGAGPNHVLPTGSTARFTGGLSVLTFLRMRTWLALETPGAASALIADAVSLARLEGLEGHARSALCRRLER